MPDDASAKTDEQPMQGEKPANPSVTRGDAIAVVALAAIFLVSVSVIAYRQHTVGKNIEVIRGNTGGETYLINLNTAAQQELMLLPGIGKVRSERLVKWREEHGPFTSLDQVREAARLSERGIEKLREFVALGSHEENHGKNETHESKR